MRLVLISFIFLIVALSAKAQDPLFSQFYSSGLYLNPAISSSEDNIFFGANYRSQWSAADVPYTTYQLSFIYPLLTKGPKPDHIGGIGLSVFRDETGANQEFTNTGVSAAGGYNIHLDKKRRNIISTGIQMGLFQQNIDPGGLTWGSQYNPAIGFDASLAGEGITDATNIYGVVNAGVLWSHRGDPIFSKFSTSHGIAVNSINRPSQSLISNDQQLPVLYKAHGIFNYRISSNVVISPSYVVYHQNENSELNIGSFITYFLNYNNKPSNHRLLLGSWYRTNGSFIFTAGYRGETLEVGASFDLNTSLLQRFLGTAGAYEFAITYRINKNNSLRRFSTPMI